MKNLGKTVSVNLHIMAAKVCQVVCKRLCQVQSSKRNHQLRKLVLFCPNPKALLIRKNIFIFIQNNFKHFKTMNTTTLKTIAKGALTGISLIVSVVQLVEFTTHTVMWYRNRKIATDTNSVAED